MRGSTTIKDIARAAQVAPSTVSRALRTDPRISEETTALIHRLAQEMDYTPSLAARHLVMQRTNTVGLVVSWISDPFVGDVVVGVEQAARGYGYSVFLISSYRDAKREEEAVQSLHERRTDGIIVTGSQIDEGYLARANRSAQPIVLINCPTYPHSISIDNVAGACDAVTHLVQLGHRRIGYIANPGSQQANLDRAAGYKAILNHHELSVDDDLVIEGDGTLSGGKRACRQLLTLSRPPTAVFCFNDMTAIGAVSAICEAGLRVPADCSVIGFDDLELAAYCCPPLTTVRQPRGQLGQHAMNMLHRLIQGWGDVEPEILPAKLVVRETTGPAPMTVGSRKEVN
jgi:LacI family repressor for deo operon, udp, cdd, tsx, nupC, and nupG